MTAQLQQWGMMKLFEYVTAITILLCAYIFEIYIMTKLAYIFKTKSTS